MSNEIQTLTTTKRTAGRPRKVRLDDDAGLLDSMLRIQIRIAEDAKSNAATRQRAADSVADLIRTRAQQKDDAAKTALANENTRLQSEIVTLTQQVNELRQSLSGKIDPAEVATMRNELTRLQSDATTLSARMTAAESVRDAATSALRYAVQTLGPEGCKRVAMKLLIDERATKDLLELLDADATWLGLTVEYKSKAQLLGVLRNAKTDRVTSLKEYCRLRLSVENSIDDVEAELKRIIEAEESERMANTLRMVEGMRTGRL